MMNLIYQHGLRQEKKSDLDVVVGDAVVEVGDVELGGLVEGGHHRRLGLDGPISSISHGPRMCVRFIQ